MPRGPRLLRLGGWLVSAFVLASLHFSDAQTMRCFAAGIMIATCGGTVLHVISAVRRRGHARRVWSLTAAGLACWAFAEVSVGVPTLVSGVAPGRGDLANLLNLGSLVFAVAAMLILPTAPRNAAGKLRMLLDGLVAAAGLFGIAWVLVLAPLTRLEGSKQAFFDLAYPILAVGVLAVAVILMAGHRRRQAGAMKAITGGVLLVSLTLLAEVAGQVAGLAWLRPWVLDGYVGSALLLAVAPLFALPRRDGRVWQPATLTASMLPFLPLVGYGLVCIGPTFAGRTLDRQALWAGAVMVGALLARQFFTIRRNVALTNDIAEQRSRFEFEAVHDALTGLPNRALLNDVLLRTTDDATLLMIDLDGFKAVNDTLGHAAGDELLVVIADRLRAAIEPFGAEAVGARLGGDEFAVLLHEGGLLRATELARTLLDSCARPVPLNGRTATVRASIGIAERRPGRTADRLLHEADLALYEAKHRGKGQFRLFDRALSAAVEAQRRLESELGEALAAGQFELVYQPVVDLATARTIGVEQSLRWHHPRLGLLRPEAFLPAAADAGLLPEIDRWVIDVATRQLAAWRAEDPRFRLSLHLSARYLGAGTAVGDLHRALTAHDLPGAAVVVRMTDTAELIELEEVLREMRSLGVQVGLEDFGVGHSAVVHLSRHHVDLVRLDPIFLRDLDRSPSAATLLGALIDRAASVGISCSAGGVETADQAEHLRRLGCRAAQGPLFGPAAPAAGILPQAQVEYAS